MRRCVAWLTAAIVALAAVPVQAAPPADLQYFVGTWHCGNERWTYSPFGTNWVRIEYAHGDTIDGIAYAGYVAQLDAYVYRDFHADGSYAELFSAPPAATGQWKWHGPYYAAGQTGPLNGEISYTETNETAFARAFASREKDGTLTPRGGDVCTKEKLR